MRREPENISLSCGSAIISQAMGFLSLILVQMSLTLHFQKCQVGSWKLLSMRWRALHGAAVGALRGWKVGAGNGPDVWGLEGELGGGGEGGPGGGGGGGSEGHQGGAPPGRASGDV